MASIKIRNLPDDVHLALRLRAAENGRSTAAEIRCILEEAVRPAQRLKLGSVLAALGDKYKLELDLTKEQLPGRPVGFE